MISDPYERLEKFYKHIGEKIKNGEMSPWTGIERAILEIYADWEVLDNAGQFEENKERVEHE